MKRTVVAAVMVALAATACGGSGGGATPTAADTTTAPGSVPSSGAAPVPGASGFSEQCLKAAQAFGQATQSLAAGPSADLGTQMAAVAAQLHAIQGVVPAGNVRDAVGTLADAYSSFADKVKGLNYTPSSGQAPPQAYIAAIQSFSDPKFTAAAQTLSGYFGSSCHG